ncbi:MAG: PA14 domain-containing protein, partial [bacterium]
LLDLPSIKKKNIILLSCAIGVATGIRISGLVLIIYFAFALILYKLLNKKITHGENNKKLSALKITVIVTFISLVSLAITMIGWPYLFINPLRIFEVSNYAANFNGMKNEYVFSYIWNRFNFQLPELHIVLLYLSLLFMTDKAYSLYKNKFKMPKDTFLTILSTFIIILSITFPLLVIILKSTPLYNELRQILFIIPPLSCLLALTFYVLLSEYRYLQYSVAAFFSIALITSLHLTPENMLLRLTVIVLLTFVFSFILKSINLKNVKWLIIIVALLSLYQSTRVMFSLHPYEYTYYNKFIGGLNGAMSNGYDADYWLINYKETLDKFKTYIDKKHPEMKTVKIGCCTMPVNIKPYLGNKLILENNPDKMDFFIFTEKAYGCHPKDYFRDAKLVIETKRDDVRLGGIFDVRATKNRLLPNDYRTQRGKLDLRIRTLSTNDSNLDYSLDAWTVLDKRLSIPSFNFPLSSSLYNQDVGFFPLLYYNSFVLDMNSVLVVKKAGFYKIHISADNGVRLSLNGKIISELQTIKQFSPTSSLYNSKETETFLDKGKYHLNILYTHIPEALIKIVVKYKRSNQQKYFMIGENSEDISFVSDN